MERKVLNSKECEIMFVCRKCGKENEGEAISHKFHLEHRRGKLSSYKICSECN